MIRISISEQDAAPRLVTFNKSQVTLGRGAHHDIVLAGKGVSGDHCRITRVPGGYQVEDLGSTNGTYVNGQRVTAPRAVGGQDDLVVAAYHLRLLEDPSAMARPATGVLPVQTSGAMAAIPTPGAAGPSASPSSPQQTPTVTGHVPVATTSQMSQPSIGDGRLQADDVRWAREWERIDKLAAEWIAARRDRAKLLRGDKLAHARQWLAQGRGKKPAPKREHVEFITEAVRASQRRIVSRVAVGGLAAGAIGVAAIVVIKQLPDDSGAADTSIQSSGAGDDTTPDEPTPTPVDPARAREASDALAGKAQALVESAPEVAALVAVAALERLPTSLDIDVRGSLAERTLRSALAKIHGQPLRGDEGSIAAVAISPDGRWAATASDATARLWDLHGRGAAKARPLRGHIQPIRALAITTDGHWLVTAGDDETIYRWDLTSEDPPSAYVTISGHEEHVTAIAVSSDGTLLLTGNRSGRAHVSDLVTLGETRKLEAHAGSITAVAFASGGARAFTAGEDGLTLGVRLVAGVPSGKVTRFEGHTGAIRDIAVSPDGRVLLTGGEDMSARLWDTNARVPATSATLLGLPAQEREGAGAPGHTGPIAHVAFSPDGKLALTASDDHEVWAWRTDVDQPELSAVKFAVHEDDITALVAIGKSTAAGAAEPAWSVSASSDGTVRTWNLSQRDRTVEGVTLRGHEGPVRAIAISADGQWLVSGGADKSARVWETHGGRPGGASLAARGHTAQVLDVAVGLAGARLLTGSADGTARWWNVSQAGRVTMLHALEGHEGRVMAVAIGGGGSIGATADDKGGLLLWDLGLAEPASGKLAGHTAEIRDVVFADGGKKLISISADKSARVWKLVGDTAQINASAAVLPHRDEVRSVAIGHDGRWLLTATLRTVHLWDLSLDDPASATGELPGHESDIQTVVFSPKQALAVSAGADPFAILWDLSGPTPKQQKLRGHGETIDAAAFSPDGKWLATGSRDKTVVLWNVASDHPDEGKRALAGHEQAVTALEFSPDSKWLFSSSNDGTIRAWPIASADPQADAMVLAGHDGVVKALAVDPSAAYVASASYDGTARVWPLTGMWLAQLACAQAGRELTTQEWAEHVGGSWKAVCG
jgi:WD40 repeat protein